MTTRFRSLGDLLILGGASVVAAVFSGPVAYGWAAVGWGVASIALWLAFSRVLRHYDERNGRGVHGDIALTAVLLAAVLVPLGLARLIVPSIAPSSDFLSFVVLVVPGVVSLRFATTWMLRREQPPERVIIVGIGALGRLTGVALRDHAGRAIVGYMRYADEPIHDRLPAPVLGVVADLDEAFKEHFVDEVYIANGRDVHHDATQRCISVCERYGVPFALPACGFRFGRAHPVHEEAVADGYIHYQSVKHRRFQIGAKRCIDIVASAIGIALLSPLLLIVAVLVKTTSQGPVLFKQTRVGLHGREFPMLKFRSMVANAEALKAALADKNEQSGPVFKIRHDPRITRIGAFLRKYSIDELPQLINVLRGEMTLVGPRPALPSEVARYEAWQWRRLSVRPGITCVWQVSGRNEISFEGWMYFDMQYIDHWSLAEDFRLLLRTVPVVLGGKGAS